jgi:RimJ/RimL family protein N-acetyltransferase
LEDADGRREIELGYRIARPYWGQGLATEAAGAAVRYAFDQLMLERVVSSIDGKNTASIRVAEKIGMSYQRDIELKDGRRAQLYSVHKP